MSTTIFGPSLLSIEGMAAYMAAKCPAAPRGQARTIALVADLFGVRAEVILGQQIHETGSYLFPGCGRDAYGGCREFNNYAGIKTTDSAAIANFATPFWGTVAQAAHLAWYGAADHVVPLLCSLVTDPRHFGAHRHNCVTVSDLSGKWAPAITDPAAGTIGYGDRIEAKIAEIMEFDQRRRTMMAVVAP